MPPPTDSSDHGDADQTGAARPDARPRFRRPLVNANAEQLSPVVDDRARLEAAHRSAAALVAGARGRPDGEVAERLGNFVAGEGILELAALWAEAPAVSLPGALYQLVLLREWITRSPLEASRFFAAGRSVAEVNTVVAGVADPPTPEAVVSLADTVLSAGFRRRPRRRPRPRGRLLPGDRRRPSPRHTGRRRRHQPARRGEPHHGRQSDASRERLAGEPAGLTGSLRPSGVTTARYTAVGAGLR